MTIEWAATSATTDGCDGIGALVTEAPQPLQTLATRSGFAAKPGEVLRHGDTVAHVTVGIGSTPDGATLRRAGAELGRALRHCERISVSVPEIDGLAVGEVARAVAEGIALGTHRFMAHKSDPEPDRLAHVELVHPDVDAVEDALVIAVPIIGATTLARDLANETPARMTARRLADVAVSVAAEHGLAVDVWDDDRIERERLGCLRAVNAGSVEPARVVWLDHAPANAAAHLVFVGKGITFDSGGLSLKPPSGMYEMKADMAGAAAVIAAVAACATLAVRVRVTGIVVATDNLPGPDATKPGEIVTARNGTTVEILDTDAEGRLVLADGLSLAAELAPDAVVDVATLTGYARVLGTHFTPVMANDDTLRAAIVVAGAAAGETIWPLPLPEALVAAHESPLADLRNIPDPDDAGTVAPGVFLRHFVGAVPWAHLDIGETGFVGKDTAELTRGATGAMTRTLVELARSWGSRA